LIHIGKILLIVWEKIKQKYKKTKKEENISIISEKKE